MQKQKSGKDRFTTSEVAAGSGLSTRNVMYLCSQGLIPVAEGGEGRGRHRQLDYEGLARSAVIAAFFDAGTEIYLASRLVHEIGEETSFHNLANLDSFLSRPYSGVVKFMIDENLDADDAYVLHETLRRRSNNYKPHVSMPYDRLIEIFDRAYVLLNHLIEDEDSGDLAPGDKPAALYAIEGWKKGMHDFEISSAPSHVMGQLPARWKAARANFHGMTRVNASLAIRDALDVIASKRGG